MNLSTDPKMLVAGLAITILAIAVAHLVDRFLHPDDARLATRLARYTGGCLAILAGLAAVLDLPTLALVALFFTVAGLTTVLCHTITTAILASNRARAAEQALDRNHE